MVRANVCVRAPFFVGNNGGVSIGRGRVDRKKNTEKMYTAPKDTYQTKMS